MTNINRERHISKLEIGKCEKDVGCVRAKLQSQVFN